MNEAQELQGPFVVLQVVGARVALPIEVVARMEASTAETPLDLGLLTGLCTEAAPRAQTIALKTAAGVIPIGVDALEDVMAVADLLPLPPLTRLTMPGAIRGLLYPSGERSVEPVVLIDGDAFGDHIAEIVLGRSAR